jgi:hypothetical protein
MPHSTLPAADAEALGQPVRRFIADHIIPLEQKAFAAGVDAKLRIQMQQLAHDAGVLAPQAPAGYGGGGADFVTTAVLLEEARWARWRSQPESTRCLPVTASASPGRDEGAPEPVSCLRSLCPARGSQSGRIAQRKSARLTSEKPQVRTLLRPPDFCS